VSTPWVEAGAVIAVTVVVLLATTVYVGITRIRAVLALRRE
jgi:hypothetical protein